MKKSILILLISLLLLSLSSCAPNQSLAPSDNPTKPTENGMPEYLVLISIDAGRPEYLDLVSMPNLRSLIASGTFYPQAWVGSLENNTPASHTVMATGSFPKSNGIIGFTWTNAESGLKINPTSLDAVNRGEMAAIVKQSGVPTLSDLFKARYPQGRVIVVSSHKYYAAQGLGVGASDFIVYAQSGKQARQMAATQGVELPSNGMMIPACLEGHELPLDDLLDPALRFDSLNAGDDSRFVFNAARVLFEKYQPRALLLNLPEPDMVGHRTGGINAPESIQPVMTAIDEGLGGLMEVYRQAGIFDQTLWVITADHGMTPNTDAVDGGMILEASLSVCPRCRVNGNSQYLVLPKKASQVAESIAGANIAGVNGVYARVKTGNDYQYQPAASTADTIDPDLNKAYLYLLDSFRGPDSPDIVVASKYNVLPANDAGQMGGKHSAPNWADQHIFLVLSGPGVWPGKTSSAPARLVDILPTIARLMGLNSLNMDGIVLGDALQDPLRKDIEDQVKSDVTLTPLRDALKKYG